MNFLPSPNFNSLNYVHPWTSIYTCLLAVSFVSGFKAILHIYCKYMHILACYWLLLINEIVRKQWQDCATHYFDVWIIFFVIFNEKWQILLVYKMFITNIHSLTAKVLNKHNEQFIRTARVFFFRTFGIFSRSNNWSKKIMYWYWKESFVDGCHITS